MSAMISATSGHSTAVPAAAGHGQRRVLVADELGDGVDTRLPGTGGGAPAPSSPACFRPALSRIRLTPPVPYPGRNPARGPLADSGSCRGDAHPAFGQDIEDLGEQVVRAAVGREDMRQMLARDFRVPPEERRGGGVPEATAQAVGEGVQAAAEVAARSVDGLAECQVEARYVGDVPAVELVRVTGRPVLVPAPAGPLPDEAEPGPASPGVEGRPGAGRGRAAGEPPLPDRPGVFRDGREEPRVELQIDQLRPESGRTRGATRSSGSTRVNSRQEPSHRYSSCSRTEPR